MAEPVAIYFGSHRCRLKWHRARRHASDTPFTPDRIRQGLAAGAAVEIDLNPLACGGWAVLHDATLDRETTGTGPVSAMTAADLENRYLRGTDGVPTCFSVATLATLAADLAGVPLPAGGHLQLDLKVGTDALTPENIAGFAAAVGPVAQHMILSGGDAEAVLRLARASGVGIGFDPCHAARMTDLVRSRDFAGFVTEAMAAMPDARIIYLYRGLVSFADSHGTDLIGPFRAKGHEVDVYTFPDAAPDTIAEIRRLMALGADQITTDDPAAVAAALAPEPS